MLFLGNAWGHDFDFHASLWIEAESQFRQGVLYPHWAGLANVGFGEPSFTMYPPVSWFAGGLLGLLLPWRLAICAFVFLTLAGAGFAMWRFVSDWLGPVAAAIAGILYLLNPYLLATMYIRCDYAEVVAIAVFPLLIRAAIRTLRGGITDGLPVIPAFGAIWLSDLPAGVIASYSLALVVLVGSIARRSWRPVLAGAVAVLGTFGSIAFFLLPAAWERQWIEMSLAFQPDWTPETNFLFRHVSDAIMAGVNRGMSGMAVLFIAAGAIGVCYTKRFRSRNADVWQIVVALGGVSAFLMFPASRLLWRVMPELSAVEYPWRWLTPLAAASVFMVSAAIAEAEVSKSRWLRVGVTAASFGVLCAVLYIVHWDGGSRHLNGLVEEAQTGSGYRFNDAKNWRRPLGSRPALLAASAPLAEPADSDSDLQVRIERWAPERKILAVVSRQPDRIRLKLLNYPAWRASANQGRVSLETDKETGQMLLEVPSGSTRVEIDYTRTWDRTAGMIVSCLTILGLLAWFCSLRKVPVLPGSADALPVR
jgi:hypothetical protein